MIRNFLFWTATCLFAVCAVSSCESSDDDDGSTVSAAFSITVSDVTASAATVEFSTAQEGVTAYLVAGPVPVSEFEYAGRDAIDRLAFIQEHGETAEAPYLKTIGDLAANETYSIGAVGLDAAGTVITAPVFERFSTEYASAAVDASFEQNPDGSYTFTGTIIPNAYTASYRYLFDSKHNDASNEELQAMLEAGGEGIETGKGEKTITLTLDEKAGVTLAVLAYDDAGRPGSFANCYVSPEDSATVLVNGQETKLSKPDPEQKLFEGEIAVPAQGSFVIAINKVEYGYTAYSGNGGVGTVNALTAAVPFYSLDASAGRGFSCKQAVGQMQTIEEGGNTFWTNLSEAGTLYVRVDATNADNIPRYYLRLVEAEDPDLILEQNFDLFVYGGNYTEAATGTAAPNQNADQIDGTEPGTQNGSKATDTGVDIWSNIATETSYIMASEAYIRNRDMEDWEVVNVAEQPGAVRLNKSTSTSHKYSGYLLTPPLTKLNSATTITVEADMARFAGDGDIWITVEGAGTLTDAAVNVNGAVAPTTCPVSGNSLVVTNDMCSKYANSEKPKPWTHVTLTVTGATAETRIRFDGTKGENSSVGRCLLDNIKITK